MTSIHSKQSSDRELRQFSIARRFGGFDPRWDALSRSEFVDFIMITQFKPENQYHLWAGFCILAGLETGEAQGPLPAQGKENLYPDHGAAVFENDGDFLMRERVKRKYRIFLPIIYGPGYGNIDMLWFWRFNYRKDDVLSNGISMANGCERWFFERLQPSFFNSGRRRNPAIADVPILRPCGEYFQCSRKRRFIIEE
jgi:hypothetical protein